MGISKSRARHNTLVGGHLEFLGAPGPGVRKWTEKGLCIASKKTKTIFQIGGWRRYLGPSRVHVIRRCCFGGYARAFGYGSGFVMFCATAREYAMVIGRAFGSVDELGSWKRRNDFC